MKSLSLVMLCIVCCFVLVSCSGEKRVTGGAADVDSLVRQFRDACKAEDIKKIESLYCWEGIPKERKDTILKNCRDKYFGAELKEVAYAAYEEKDIEQENKPYKSKKGMRYPNVRFLGTIGIRSVKGGIPNLTVVKYGKKDGKYFIGLSK